MTSGGGSVTNGERRARLLALAMFAALGLPFAIVNALSELDERERMGRPLDPWEPWTWELTSFLGFLLVAPSIFRLSQSLRPPRLAWPAAIGIHVPSSVMASIAHVALMVAMRHLVYSLQGESYEAPGPLLDMLVYEYRKDLISYAVLAALPHVAARLLEARQPRAPAAAAAEYRIEVRDGTRTVRLAPADVEWAQAAGNYVELYGSFGTLLHRRTLAALEEELRPHGFARIHRSRIVRTAAIAAVETKPSGDFEVTMASGAVVGASRRYRANLG